MDSQTLQTILLAIIAIEGAIISYTFISTTVNTQPTQNDEPIPDEPKVSGTTIGGNNPGPSRPKGFRVVVEQPATDTVINS